MVVGAYFNLYIHARAENARLQLVHVVNPVLRGKALAKRLGCRPEQLSQRLFRARRKLKAHLESEGAI